MAVSLDIGKTLADFCRPDRMALVVYDMQAGITNQVKNGPAILAEVLKVLEAARAGGYPIIFLRHLSMPKPLMGAFQMRQAMAWQRTDGSRCRQALVPARHAGLRAGGGTGAARR